MNGTSITDPTKFLDSSGENDTVEVGVIVIGLCCICLVACALVVLQLRSNSSRTTGSRRQRPENSGDGSGDRTRDPLDLEAPPSYDAVIRSPHLYPPSRRTSMTLDVSETRRSSDSSSFSLTLHSPCFIHHPRVVPRETTEDNLSQHSSIEVRVHRTEDTEDLPPPYPGNVMLVAPRNTRSMEHICHPRSPSPGQSTRTRHIETASDSIALGSLNARSTRASPSQLHIVGPSRNQVVNAWSDNETRRKSSHDVRNEVCRTHHHHSNVDISTSRTVVSHSERGPMEVVSTTPMIPPETLQDIDTS